MGHEDEDCAACHEEIDGVHIDGNMKLFTYANSHEPHRRLYYEDMLFVPDDHVKNHEKALDLAIPGLQRVGHHFG